MHLRPHRLLPLMPFFRLCQILTPNPLPSTDEPTAMPLPPCAYVFLRYLDPSPHPVCHARHPRVPEESILHRKHLGLVPGYHAVGTHLWQGHDLDTSGLDWVLVLLRGAQKPTMPSRKCLWLAWPGRRPPPLLPVASIRPPIVLDPAGV